MQTPESPLPQSQLLIGPKREQLEAVAWAIVKVNRQEVFTYGNRAMCEIVGAESIEGKTLADVFRGDDLAAVRGHLESRFSRRAADEYDVGVTRLTDNVRVPIRCLAMPDINDHGEVVGAIAIVRDLLAEDVSGAVYKAIEDLRDSRGILQALVSECKRIVPFDFLYANHYSEDLEHSCVLYLYPEDLRLDVGWRGISAYGKTLLEAKNVVIVADLMEWLSRSTSELYRNDPDTQRFLKLGLHSILSFPVISGNRVVGTIGFCRKRDKGSFSEMDKQRLARLPLAAAVRMALHYRERDELNFRLNLITQIASSRSTNLIAETVVEQLADHYKWEKISIFRPDEQEKQFSLVKQKAQKESGRLPIDKGVMGQVYRTRTALNVFDVTAPEFKDLYLSSFVEYRSELCMPVLVGGRRVYWILKVEDSKRNAFAKEEQDALADILQQVAVVLELVSETQIFTELLRCSRDSVIRTDFRGTIEQTNQATKALLGYSEDEMKGTAFAYYFKNKDLAQRVQEARYVPNDEVHMTRKDGSDVSLLLSGTSLPREIGLRVYIANDLSTWTRKLTVEILRQMYNEIASQIKTPLSLAFTWLHKLGNTDIPQRAADLLDNAVKQLHKVDLTFDRLLFYERQRGIAAAERSLFDIPVLIEKIRQELPDSEASRIEVTASADVPPVSGDIFQIWFCLESLLTYLVRFVSEEEKVLVDISSRDGQAVTVFRGRAPRVTGGTITEYAEARWAIRAITEMAMGEQMIQSFIEQNHAGEFHKQSSDGDLMEYVVALPGFTQRRT